MAEDEISIQELRNVYGSLVETLIRSWMGKGSESDEVIGECWLSLFDWCRRHKKLPSASLVRVVARARYVEHVLENKRKRFYEHIAEDVDVEPVPFTLTKEEMGSLLTRRQLDCAKLIARGYSNKDIATKLRIKYSTVRSHLRHVYSSIGIHHRPSAREFLSKVFVFVMTMLLSIMLVFVLSTVAQEQGGGNRSFATFSFFVDGAVLIVLFKAVEYLMRVLFELVSKTKKKNGNGNEKNGKKSAEAPGEGEICRKRGEDLATLMQFKSTTETALERLERKMDRLLLLVGTVKR